MYPQFAAGYRSYGSQESTYIGTGNQACRRFRLVCFSLAYSSFGHRMHIGRRESAPADGPVTTFKLVDTNPGQREHVLAFYLDHRSRNFLDKLLFLIRGKNVPDDVDRHE